MKIGLVFGNVLARNGGAEEREGRWWRNRGVAGRRDEKA